MNLKQRIKKVKSMVVIVLMLVLVTIPVSANKAGGKPLVQMAILLDTSNSMDGLIDQAKSQLWKIVNEMATAKKNGVMPNLKVSLYEYGKSSLPAGEGYLRMIVPLSQDLDKISEELFNLKTNGGSEFCGYVIRSATRELKWDKSNDHLKVIFIAGNESFSQGAVDYQRSCEEAIAKGIIVNTIFCGDYSEGVRTFWKRGAELADGRYINIDKDKKTVHIPAPQDKEIVELGKKLNKTYIAYGKSGRISKERQEAQDSNAAGAGASVAVQRSYAKASKQYKNVTWDLVDAEKEGKIKVEELDENVLPPKMKKMSKDERKKFIESMGKEREKLQKKINELRKARDKFVAEKRKKMAGNETLDSAIIKAVKEQAGKKNFKFEKN